MSHDCLTSGGLDVGLWVGLVVGLVVGFLVGLDWLGSSVGLP